MDNSKSELIKRVYEETKSVKQTSEIIGMTPNGIYYVLKKIGSFRKEWGNKKNVFFERDNCIVLMTNKNQEIIIDRDDFDFVRQHKWCVSKTGYAVANICGKVTKMHRFILGITDKNKIIDHKNRNKLDNRRENLRFCTPQQNSMNCSPTKGRKLPIGISMSSSKHPKYRARIMVNRKEIRLGNFDLLEDAVLARKEGEKMYFEGFRT